MMECKVRYSVTSHLCRTWLNAVAAQLALVLIVSIPISARAADDAGCRENGPLKICALHAAISPNGKGDNIEIHGDITIKVENTGALPVTLFASTDSLAMLLPDHGPAITGDATVSGLPRCGNTVSICVSGGHLTGLVLRPHGVATFGVRISKWLPLDNVRRMALANSATFSYAVGMIDGEQIAQLFSLSVPVMTLDNGLTASR